MQEGIKEKFYKLIEIQAILCEPVTVFRFILEISDSMSHLLKVNSRVEGKTEKLKHLVGTIKQIKREEKKATSFRVLWDNNEYNWLSCRSIAPLGTRAHANLWIPANDDEDSDVENLQLPIVRDNDPGDVQLDFDDNLSVDSDDIDQIVEGDRMYVNFGDNLFFTKYRFSSSNFDNFLLTGILQIGEMMRTTKFLIVF